MFGFSICGYVHIQVHGGVYVCRRMCMYGLILDRILIFRLLAAISPIGTSFSALDGHGPR